MKMTPKFRWMLAALLGAGSAFAQTGTDLKPVRPDSPSDQVRPITEQGRKIGRPEKPRNSGEISSVTRPELVQPVELKTLIERFQAAREEFLRRQKLLQSQFRQSTEEQRAELREQMRENLEQWRDLQLEFRTQLKERAVELRRELQGQLREVVNDGGKEGEGGRRRE